MASAQDPMIGTQSLDAYSVRAARDLLYLFPLESFTTRQQSKRSNANSSEEERRWDSLMSSSRTHKNARRPSLGVSDAPLSDEEYSSRQRTARDCWR